MCRQTDRQTADTQRLSTDVSASRAACSREKGAPGRETREGQGQSC